MKNINPKKIIIFGVKHFTLLIGLLLGNLYARAQAPDFDWARQANSAVGNGIAHDAQGNSYVTGSFRSSATFGSTTLTSSGNTDVFVAKYDAAGNLLWAHKAGGTGYDEAKSIAIDGNGNSYVTGHFEASAFFGSTTLNSSGWWDFFVAKYDAAGNLLWAKQASGGDGYEQGNSIAVDGSGNSYITGYFNRNIIFGSTTLTNFEKQCSEVFVAKYDAAGNVLWAKQAGGKWNSQGTGIAIDGSGCYVTGYFQASLTFGSTTIINTNGANTSLKSPKCTADVFLAKYDAAGNLQWAKKAGGGTGIDEGKSIAIDGSGNSYVTGFFQGNAIFGSITLTGSGVRDIFVAKYNAAGIVEWAKKASGNPWEEAAQNIAVDASGNSYVAGSFSGSATFGSTTLTSSGSADVFVAKYDAAGNVVWAKNAGGTGFDYGNGIAIDGSGNSYITGKFQRSVAFGSTTLTTTGTEFFIAKINAAIPLAKYALPTAGTGSDGNVLQVHDVNAYPNPFTDKLILELTSDATAETAKVTLNTIDGKTVFQKEVKLNKGRVSEELDGLSELPAGMYFLMLHLDEKPIVLKVMKQ